MEKTPFSKGTVRVTTPVNVEVIYLNSRFVGQAIIAREELRGYLKESEYAQSALHHVNSFLDNLVTTLAE